MKHLKNVGFGKTAMEKEIQNELTNVIEYIDKNKTTPINPKSILAMSVMNILWKFTAGKYLSLSLYPLILNVYTYKLKIIIC